MKHKLAAVIISLFIIAIVGSGFYALLKPDSQYHSVDWESYEHTDAYDYHYYLQLDKKEKIAYENILNEYKTFPERIEVPELDNAELKKVFTAVLYDNPILFCFERNCKMLSSGSKYYFKPEYTMPKSEYEEKVREIYNLTPDIIADIPATEFDIELYLHDYIIDRCLYSDSGSFYESNIYGALIEGEASCEGYSHAMKYLSDLCNLDCYVVFGSAQSSKGDDGYHMWNIINIDGEYYHLDLTWNDTVAKDTYSDDHRYMYFNISDEEILNTHSDFKTDDKCTSDKANYYVRNNLSFNTFGEVEKKQLAKIIAAAADDGKSSASVRFSNKTLYGQSKNALLDEQQIFLVLAEADRISDKTIRTEKFRYRCVDNVNILEIMFSVV